MKSVRAKLTIIFDNSFWCGVYEKEYNHEYEVCKIIFGHEPRDYEVYQYLLKNDSNLVFGKFVESEAILKKKLILSVDKGRLEKKLAMQVLELNLSKH